MREKKQRFHCGSLWTFSEGSVMYYVNVKGYKCLFFVLASSYFIIFFKNIKEKSTFQSLIRIVSLGTCKARLISSYRESCCSRDFTGIIFYCFAGLFLLCQRIYFSYGSRSDRHSLSLGCLVLLVSRIDLFMSVLFKPAMHQQWAIYDNCL